MADDIEAHTTELSLAKGTTALDAVRAAVARGVLPAVAGGSTWIAYADRRPVAIATRDRRGSASVQPIGDPSGPAPTELFFAYYLANDPGRLIAELAAGRTPERRHAEWLRD